MAEQLGECSAIFSDPRGTLPAQTPEALCHVEERSFVMLPWQLRARLSTLFPTPQRCSAHRNGNAIGHWRLVHQEGLSMRFACHSLWQSSQEGQVELLTYVASLCADDAPMVACSCQHLGLVAGKADISNVLAKILPAYEKLCIKDTDSVRVLAMAQTSALAQLLNNEQMSQTLLRIIQDCHRDRSWRVRLALANDLGAIAEAGGKEFCSAYILSIVMVLIDDPEPEVRECAIRQLVPICAVVGEEAFGKACLVEINQTRFAEEEEVKVQTAFAEMIMGLIPLISSEVAQAQLVPLITDTLRRQLDEESEGFQHMNQAMINMKLKVFRQMETLIKTLPSQPANAFTQDVLLEVVRDCCITEHYEDSYGGLVALYDTQQFNWRAREHSGAYP